LNSQIESARKILEIIKEERILTNLSDLARKAGFPRVSDRNFKAGFNYLIERKIVKLQQAGWSSEKRGTKNHHPKSVLLIADLYQLTNEESSISRESLDELGIANVGSSAYSKGLPLSRIKEYEGCADCLRSPVVFLTPQKIPVCSKHWQVLANTDLEW
jgi:hypothetical protein